MTIGSLTVLSFLVGYVFNLERVIDNQTRDKSLIENPNYQLAKRLINSNLQMNCYQFKNFWQSLVPNSNCYRMKNLSHWYCEIPNTELFIDWNWKLDYKGRIFKK